MNDIVEYKLLTGEDNSEFCDRVTEFLNKGWELHGSPIMHTDSSWKNHRIVGQAVVRRNKN
tara:strand:- start:212 stop:394 length:183 start_codon:yes stop_codon:yes gene_type:complete